MGQTQTATLTDARKLVSLRAILQMPCHGVFGQLAGGQIIPDEEFVAGQDPAILLIKVVDRPENPDSPDVREFDDFINVGATWDTIRRAPHADAAIKRMIAMESPGISDSAIENRLMNLPGVQSAWRAAINTAVEEL